MAVTRAKHVTTSGNNPTASFGSAPAQGSLLVAMAFTRTGTSPTLTSSGWTNRIARNTLLTDSTFRRSFYVWTKIAGASESTSVVFGGGQSFVAIHEYTGSAGETFAFLNAVSNDDGATSNATNITTGTSGSVSGNILQVVLRGTRLNNGGAVTGGAWDFATSHAQVDEGGFNRYYATGFREVSGASGTYIDEHTVNPYAGTGNSAGLLTFETTTSGGTTPISVTPALTFTVSPSRVVDRKHTVSASLGVSFLRSISRNISVTASLAPAVRRVVSRSLGIPLSLSSSLTRALTKRIEVPLTMSVSVATTRSLAVQVVAALLFNTSLRRDINRVSSLSLGLNPIVSRVINRNIASDLSFTVFVSRVVAKLLATPISFSTSISRIVERKLGFSLNFGTTVDAVKQGASVIFDVAVVVPLTFAVRVFTGLPGSVVGGVQRARHIVLRAFGIK